MQATTVIELQAQTLTTAAGKLPPEAPPPVEGFGLHVQSLKNLVSAGLDMKNSADHQALVLPLLQRCGGSIEELASRIKANLNGGLLDSDDITSRKSAYGENRLPQKPMVKQDILLLVHLEYQRQKHSSSVDSFSFSHIFAGHILGTLSRCPRRHHSSNPLRCISCLYHTWLRS
jgi:hypothetical protein